MAIFLKKILSEIYKTRISNIRASMYSSCRDNSDIKIRSNTKIKGILINDKELKISLMAIREFPKFTICSGLKLNIEKTEIIPLENLINKSETKILPQSLTERLNMPKLINLWNSRSLSLRSKIMIIRALILPQIKFLFSMIETPEQILKKIDEMLINMY